MNDEYLKNIYEKYDISDNGFIPKNKPLIYLSEYFKPWDDIAHNLPELNKKRLTRNVINNMPLLDYSKLISKQEYQRAYLILSLMTHSYVWQDGSNNVAKSIPKQLAIPFKNVSDYLQIVPIMTHAGVDLYNWKLIDENKGYVLDNFRSIHTCTGLFDEEWFYLVITAIEIQGSKIIKNILKFKFITISEKIKSLTEINESLCKINNILERINENCDPNNFWYKLRPFLSGWENNEYLPDGLLYEGVSEKPFKYAGGSAAQSSLFATIDAAFGIQHKDGYFEKIQNYMPGKHKDFIKFVKDNCKIYEFIDKNNELNKEYEKCTTNLKKFRQIHFGIVKKYIIDMAKKENKNINNNDKSSMEKGETGTGGTELEPFLKQSIQETKTRKKNRFSIFKFFL